MCFGVNHCQEKHTENLTYMCAKFQNSRARGCLESEMQIS